MLSCENALMLKYSATCGWKATENSDCKLTDGLRRLKADGIRLKD
jgi:hypothetical protein